MAADSVREVMLHSQEIDAMQCCGAVPGMVYTAVALEGLAEISYHVPVDCVLAETECLTAVSHFYVAEADAKRLVAGLSVLNVCIQLFVYVCICGKTA
jgi:hypothetical protein